MAAVLFTGCTATEKKARNDFYLNGWNDNKHFAIGQSNVVIDDSQESGLGGRSVFGPLGNMLTSALGVVDTDDPQYKAKVKKFDKNTFALLEQELPKAGIKLSEAKAGVRVLGKRNWIKQFYDANPDVPYMVAVEGVLSFNANQMMRKRKSAATLEKEFAVSYRWTFYNKEELVLSVIDTQHVRNVSGYLTYESEDFEQILKEAQRENIRQLTSVLSDIWSRSGGRQNIQAYPEVK